MTLNRKGGDEIAQTIRLRTQEKHFSGLFLNSACPFSWTVGLCLKTPRVVHRAHFLFRSAGRKLRARSVAAGPEMGPHGMQWAQLHATGSSLSLFTFISFSFLLDGSLCVLFVSLQNPLSRHKRNSIFKCTKDYSCRHTSFYCTSQRL